MGATPAEQTKSLLGREKPVDVQPGSIWLWLALLVASVFRQWAYSVLASLYALSPSDYDDKTSVRGATSLSSDEYAGIVYAYTIVAVTAMGASGACTTLFGARRTAVAGLGLQVAGCVTCGLSYGVVQLAAGTLVLSSGFGVFLTPAYSLVFGIERSGTRRVLATTTVQAAGNLGAAAASLSIVLAESFVGWRGTYFVIAAGLAASALLMVAAPDGGPRPPPTRAKPVSALFGELRSAFGWIVEGRRFFGGALAASMACGVAGTLEGTWIATYFLDNYPYYSDLYSYLTAFVITVGIGVGFLLVAGYVVDRVVVAAPFGEPTLLVVPAVALCLGAPCKLVAVIVNDDFPLAFVGEALGKAFDAFNEAPLYVALQLASPKRHRPTVVGLYLFLYWVGAASLAEIVNTCLGLNMYQVLFVACSAQFAGGVCYGLVGCLEYPDARVRADDATHAEGEDAEEDEPA